MYEYCRVNIIPHTVDYLKARRGHWTVDFRSYIRVYSRTALINMYMRRVIRHCEVSWYIN